jgi:alkylation response protein AidB-like acyl-CoA dehydrogenase
VGGGRSDPAHRRTAAPAAGGGGSRSGGLGGQALELLGADGLRYDEWWTDTWQRERPKVVDFLARSPGYRYLRAKGNSIEGGTSEILRNIIAERVLGLPGEVRVDKTVAWKDLPR